MRLYFFRYADLKLAKTVCAVENKSENLTRPDEFYHFRLIVESRLSHGKFEAIKIFQKADERYFLNYKTAHCSLSATTVAALLNLLKTIDISQAPRPAAGFDGAFYRITIGSLWNSVTFNWWTDLVDENWQPLVEFRRRIYKLCLENFAEFGEENGFDWMRY